MSKYRQLVDKIDCIRDGVHIEGPNLEKVLTVKDSDYVIEKSKDVLYFDKVNRMLVKVHFERFIFCEFKIYSVYIFPRGVVLKFLQNHPKLYKHYEPIIKNPDTVNI